MLHSPPSGLPSQISLSLHFHFHSFVIWILPSDTVTICQLNQFNTNSEAAMLSTVGGLVGGCCVRAVIRKTPIYFIVYH